MQQEYELWDIETGNWLETFDSAQAASAAIREYLALNGNEYLGALGLGVASRELPSTEMRRQPAIIGDELRDWLAMFAGQSGATTEGVSVGATQAAGASFALSAATTASFGLPRIEAAQGQGPEMWARLERSIQIWAMLRYGRWRRGEAGVTSRRSGDESRSAGRQLPA